MNNPVPLPAGVSLGHSYEYGLDVNLGTAALPNWQPVRCISNFQPSPTPTLQDAQTYDDLGSDNQDVTAWVTNLAFSVLVNRDTSTGLYLPEIEALLARTRPGAKGDAAVIEARWYHKPETGTANPNDAGQSNFTVSYTRANAGADGAVEKLNVTLTGKGPASEIENPWTGWGASAPEIQSASPAEAGTGALVTLTGKGFSGTTTVTVDATEVEFTVMGDSSLVFALEVGSAGEVPIVVTNAQGASTPFTYLRAA